MMIENRSRLNKKNITMIRNTMKNILFKVEMDSYSPENSLRKRLFPKNTSKNGNYN